jgi:hypothetical protein
MKALLRRTVVLLAVVCALGALAWLGWRHWMPAGEAPAEVAAAESALSGPDALAVASVNVERLGGLLPAAGPEAGSAPNLDALLLHRLGLRGVEIARDVSHAVVGLEKGDRGPAMSAVLFGRFDPAAVAAATSKGAASDLRDEKVGGERVLRLRTLDRESCDRTSRAIALRADRIVVARDGSIERLLKRLPPEPAPAADDSWLSRIPGLDRVLDRIPELPLLARLRSAPVASITVASAPDDLPESAHPAAHALVRAARAALGGARDARWTLHDGGVLGGLTVEIDVRAADAAKATALAARWSSFREAARPEWTQVAPGLAAWHDALAIATDGAAVRARGKRGSEATAELRLQPDEWLVLASRGFRARGGAPSEEVRPEVDPWPLPVLVEYPLTKLEPYNPDAPLALGADAIAGPFGVRVERVARSAGPRSPLEIEVLAATPQIPNVPDGREFARLILSRAADEDGESLLSGERCGAARADRPGSFVRYPLAEQFVAKHALRLRSGVRLDDVAAIDGRIELELPVRTQTMRLAAPKTGQSLSGGGASVELTSSGPDAFSYRATGERRGLVHLRGLDASGQPLVLKEAWDSELWAGDGRIGARRYAGGLAAVEAVFALELASAKWDFALESGRPGSDGTSSRVESSSFIRYTPEQYDREFAERPHEPWPAQRPTLGIVTTGPFTVALEKLDDDGVLAPKLTVLAPRVPNLAYHATGLELALESVRLHDGTALQPPTGDGWRRLLIPRHRFGRRDLESSVSFTSEAEHGANEVGRLEGRLLLRLPEAIESLELTGVEAGRAVGAEDVGFTLAELGRDGFVLRMTGPLERLFSVRAFDAEGQELSVERTAPPLTGAWRDLEFSVQGQPERISIQLVRGIATRSYAFEIPLPEPVPAAPAD